jgi:predicted phage tail protein
LAAKYILSVRRRITHTVRFKTTPQGLSLAPGNFIRVVTQANPYNGGNNGVVADDGTITSITPLANGSYSIIYYQPPATAVAAGTLTVSNGATTQSSLFGAVFTVSSGSTQNNVYMVEQLTLADDNTVQITASDFPCDSDLTSLMARDVTNDSNFIFES